MIGLGANNQAFTAPRPPPWGKRDFQINPVPPFRLDLTVWALRRRPHYLVDRWDGRTYRRILLVCEQPSEVAVTQTGQVETPLLRVLGRWSVLPGDDVGARRSLQAWLHLSEPLDYQGVRRHLSGWHPYGGLIYFHLLLNRLAEEGHLS
jgi:hypothetical protein